MDAFHRFIECRLKSTVHSRIWRCDNRSTGMTLLSLPTLPATRATPAQPTTRRRLAIALLQASLLLAGCGYHTLGAAGHLPPGISTIDVPLFATRVQAYNTEVVFTQAIVRELGTRTRYHILTHESADADAHLTGTILTQSIAPLTYDSTSGQTASYLITITAKVVLTAHDGRILYQNDSLPFRDQYQSTQDLNGFIQEDSPAVRRIAQDFARTVVDNMLESM